MVSFWTKIPTGEQTKLSFFVVYKLIRKLFTKENVDIVWPKFAKNTFDSTGFSYNIFRMKSS